MIKEVKALRHIAQLVQNAFPGRKVKVWVEQSVLYPDKKNLIVCVDQYGALITVETFDSVPEQEIASALISMLRDRMKAEEEQMNDLKNETNN